MSSELLYRQRVARNREAGFGAVPAKTWQKSIDGHWRADRIPKFGRTLMISVAAIRMQQFGVQFYQASLTANDIDKLVRFEVLSYSEQGQTPVRGGRKQAPQSKIKW